MTSAFSARELATEGLPLIDISGLASSDVARRKLVAAQLRDVCIDKGFFYITGHGIPDGLISAVLEHTKRFFDQPLEVKRRISTARSFCNRGYEDVRSQTLQSGAQPDLKEGLYLGVDLREDDPRVKARRFNRGPNQWPSDLLGFVPAMKAYFASMLHLGESMMRALALSLRLPEEYFAEFSRDTFSTLRLLHYPAPPPGASDDEMGAGAHTDFGALTFLLQDDVGGLQVRNADGEQWIAASPISGTFVVNLGDMIARWTNDLYRSTVHRVINVSGSERYSIPFFFSGNPDHLVECIPSCLPEGGEPRYQAVTVEEHFQEMFRQTYKRG